ncbi:MAG: HPr family phosphocarrier protein [Deltaproteobacteria bacterium]|nr:HPr family phosphocarrier protein [Deltaproteobacteria bacterium]MBI3387560.1 HPr family phosphocarrier protein [Deltaproteobacteria bacterium]
MEPARRTFEVQNRLGLHMRAAAMLVQTANKYDAQVTITKDGQSVDGKSIISLMMLAAAQGSVIEIEAVGSQAEELLDALGALFDRKFDEE